MIKKFGIIVFIYAILCWGLKASAQTQFSATLTKMEKSLFGVDYDSQSDDARLKRIEDVVYGKDSTGPTQQRVNKLSKDLSADLIGQEIKPKKDSFEDEDAGYKEQPLKADKNVNYPIVDSLEKKVFQKQFKGTDINQRLANLEQNVFKKTYNDDLSSRVDRLKMAVMPQKMARNEDNQDDEDSYVPNNMASDNTTGSASPLGDDDYSDYSPPLSHGLAHGLNNQVPDFTTPSYNNQNSVLDGYQDEAMGSSDIMIPLAALEKSVLKKSFPNDTVSNRLTRLELLEFNSTFADDDAQTRLDRVSSAHQAKKTSKKYDSNRLSQHMSTAVQVGAILLMILAAVL